MKLVSFFLFIFLTLSLFIPGAFGQTATVTSEILPKGEAGFEDDEIVLDNEETVDLSETVVEIEEETETIGGQEVELTQEVQFVSNDVGEVITLENTAVTNVVVEIPDQTKVKAPDTWNGEITPPKSSSGGGVVPGNFLIPTSSLLVGSPDVVLVFDKVVTIVLEDATGQTAYKLSGTDNWVLIDTCTGTYENPNDPPENKECSITDGIDTKILTFHFTEFTDLDEIDSPDDTDPDETTKSSGKGGHGKTGVGSPRIFGPSSGSSGSGGAYSPPGEITPRVIPVWFDSVKDWYREGKISATEFLNAYDWIIKNILK